jgi:hypothetical protein
MTRFDVENAIYGTIGFAAFWLFCWAVDRWLLH